MGDSGWWPMIAFVTLMIPVVIAAGIATGLLVRRWRQVALGLLAAPAAYWVYCALFSTTDRLMHLLMPLALAGLIWTAAAFGLKEASAS